MMFDSSLTHNKKMIMPPAILIKCENSALYFFIVDDKNIEINAIMAIFTIILHPKNLNLRFY